MLESILNHYTLLVDSIMVYRLGGVYSLGGRGPGVRVVNGDEIYSL